MTYEDYEVKKIDYSWDIKDAEYNPETKKFEVKSPTYTAEDILHFYGKFNGSDEWIEVGTYALSTRTANYDNNYVTSLNGSQITFVPNCTAWKVTIENAYYYTKLLAYPYYRLKNSEYIMEKIEGKTCSIKKHK